MHNGFITIHSSDLRSGEDILRLIKTAEELYASTQDSDNEDKCFIKASFVHNSQIYSSGDGFVRGGEIYAARGAQIGEAGTKGGIVTRITVPKSETIKIKMAMEDTVIEIGKKSHRFMVQTFNVVARLDDNGQLIIT